MLGNNGFVTEYSENPLRGGGTFACSRLRLGRQKCQDRHWVGKTKYNDLR